MRDDDSGGPAPLVRRLAGRALKWGAIGALLVALLCVGLYLTRDTTLHPLLRWAAPRVTPGLVGYEVRFESIAGDWVGELEVTGLEVKGADESAPLRSLDAGAVRVEGDLLAAARGAGLAALTLIRAEQPEVVARAAAGGSRAEGDEPGAIPLLPRLEVVDGRVEVRDAAGEELVSATGVRVTGGTAAGERLEVEVERAAGREWSASGAAWLERRGAREGTLTASASEVLIRGVVAGLSDLRAELSEDSARLTSGALQIGPNRIVAEGIVVSRDRSPSPSPLAPVTAGGQLTFNFPDVATASRSIETLLGREVTDRWSGSAAGTVDLTPLPGGIATGLAVITGTDLRLDGTDLGDARVTVSAPGGQFEVSSSEVDLGAGGLFREVQLAGRADAAGVDLVSGRAETPYGRLELAARWRGPAADEPWRLVLDALKLTSGEETLELEEAAAIGPAADGDGWLVQDLRLGGTAGRLTLDAGAAEDGGFRAAIDAEQLELGPFVRDARGYGPFTLEALDGHADWTSSPPALDANLHGRGVVRGSGGSEVVEVHLDGEWADGALTARRLAASSRGMRLEVKGRAGLGEGGTLGPGAPLALEGELDLRDAALDAPLGRLLFGETITAYPAARPRGEAIVRIDLEGTSEAVTGTARVLAPRIVPGRILGPAGEPWREAETDIDLTVEVAADALRARGAVEVQGRARVDVDATLGSGLSPASLLAEPGTIERWGRSALDGTLGVRVTTLADLAGYMPDLRETGGEITADLTLAGTLTRPDLTGTARLAGGTARYRGAPPLENAEFELVIDERELRLAEGRADVGAAPVRFSGRMLLGQDAPRIEASLEGENVLLVRSEDARLRADLDLEIAGRTDALTVMGEVLIVEGRVRSPVEFQSLLASGGAAPPSVNRGLRLPAFGPPSVRLDARVTTRKAIRLDGRIARGGVRADIALGGTAAEPRPSGNVFLDPLELAVPAGTLTFPSGLVTFDPAQPDIPTIDIVGETRLAGYDVTVAVSGEYDRADVELSSSPPLPPEDLLLLVLSGQPPSTGAGLEAAGQSVALYVAKDLVRGWFSSGGFDEGDRESFLDRLEVVTGRDVSRSGVLTIEATYKLREGFARDSDALYVVLERDAFEDYGLGLRLVLRLR